MGVDLLVNSNNAFVPGYKWLFKLSSYPQSFEGLKMTDQLATDNKLEDWAVWLAGHLQRCTRTPALYADDNITPESIIEDLERVIAAIKAIGSGQYTMTWG